MTRLTDHLMNVGPNIHQYQFSFRPGRSTIDAIDQVKTLAEGAILQSGVVLAVSVVVNASNSLQWKAIHDGLVKHGAPKYMQRTTSSYLAGRTTEFGTNGGLALRKIDRGVPQGSVLGPFLWNVGFNAAQNATLPIGVHITQTIHSW